MKEELVTHLREPRTGSALVLSRVSVRESGEIRDGDLAVDGGGSRVTVRSFIPRFAGESSYADSFGEQWNRYRRTQLDSRNGTTLTRDRFRSGTGWEEEDLRGNRILEAGCGAGRFTEIMLGAGAEVYAVDMSAAVDACLGNNGPHPRLHVVQADLFALPFEGGFFDKVFCYGVLQHTPDPKKAFLALTRFVKPGGEIAVDVYRRTPWITRWTAKYWYRPITRRMPRDLLRRIVEWYVPRWIPIDNFLQRVPVLKRAVPAIIPCWNYTGILPLDEKQIREWAVLDTFDALSPRYDNPQTIKDVASWFEEAGLADIRVRPGGNGILGNGRKSENRVLGDRRAADAIGSGAKSNAQ